jgi:hypothetical protein
MSVSAELWKLESAARVPQPDPTPTSAGVFGRDVLADDPFAGLVRQVFVSTESSVAPRKVLFLAADQETRVVELCEKSALTLATLSARKRQLLAEHWYPLRQNGLHRVLPNPICGALTRWR